MSTTETATPEDSTTTEPADAAGEPSVRVVDEGPGWRHRLRLDAVGRRRSGVVVVVLAVLAAALTWWLVQRDALPDGAAFRIGDEVVTAKQVERRVDGLEALYGVEVPAAGSEREDFLRDAAKSMAVQRMLQQEAEERGIVVAAKDVDSTLQGIITQRYPDGGRSAFVAALGELGATEEQVRQEIRDQILVSRLFDAVAGDVDVTEAELKEAFAQRRAELGTPVRRELRNIVVADRRSAQAVLRQLRDGSAFAAVARSASLDSATRDAGGALGAVARDDLEKAYAKAAFGARVGSFFGPVRTESGWNVGEVVRQLPARAAVYSELREELRRTVLAERSLEKWRAWLEDVIAGHDVTYADAYRPADPGAVPDIDQADVTGGR
ncbi:peptidylprolyl isomerase [Nocardioides sp. J54]|uniref:peptidylprolyl isomerase n=1 Tax=Nocardioides sp. J54 TaxID=935866 RepID=UPI0009FBC66F|nr:SurA N-terminal domain-containing protein [Nocardioides sp. J54]